MYFIIKQYWLNTNENHILKAVEKHWELNHFERPADNSLPVYFGTYKAVWMTFLPRQRHRLRDTYGSRFLINGS